MKPVIRPALLSLAVAGAVLAIVVVGEFVGGELRLGQIAAPAKLAPVQAARALAAGETAAPPEAVDGWVQTALARPLMSASRRPAAVAGGSELALGNGLPRLAGTLFQRDGATAIFARDEAGHAVIVRQGGMLGPYRVTSIAPNRVTLEGPNGLQTLHARFGEGRDGVGGGPAPYLPGPMNMPGVMPPQFGQPPFQPPQFQQPQVQPDQDNQ